MLMMAFTDFLASIFFSFRRVIWNLAHAAAKPQHEFVCELHPLTQHLVFQYFLLLFPEKHPYFVSPKTTTSHIWKLRTEPFFRTIFRPSFTLNATRFFAWNLFRWVKQQRVVILSYFHTQREIIKIFPPEISKNFDLPCWCKTKRLSVGYEAFEKSLTTKHWGTICSEMINDGTFSS